MIDPACFPEMYRASDVDEDDPSTYGASHIEPVFDPSWSPTRQLRWRAAILRVDYGIVVTVHPPRSSMEGFILSWPIRGGAEAMAGYSYTAAMDHLQGMGNGAEAALAAVESLADPA